MSPCARRWSGLPPGVGRLGSGRSSVNSTRALAGLCFFATIPAELGEYGEAFGWSQAVQYLDSPVLRLQPRAADAHHVVHGCPSSKHGSESLQVSRLAASQVEAQAETHQAMTPSSKARMKYSA